MTKTARTAGAVGVGLLVVPVIGGLALRDVCTWDNTSGGTWSEPTNWSPQEVPDTSGESASIPDDGFQYAVDLDIDPIIAWLANNNPLATVNLNDRTLTLEAAGGSTNVGVIAANGGYAWILGDLDNAAGGAIEVLAGQRLYWDDDDDPSDGVVLVNDGIVTINTDGSEGDTWLDFEADVALTGAGEILLNGDFDRAQLRTVNGVSITHDDDHLIHGYGNIRANMSNDGTIVADGAGVLTIYPGLITGEPGEITFTNEPGGLIRAESANLTIRYSDHFRNDGIVECASGTVLRADDSDYLQTSGRTIVEGEMRVPDGVLRHQGGWLVGDGVITGSVEQTAGAMLPGGVFSTGDLAISGDYDLADGGLFIDLASDSDYDLLDVAGDVTLSGTLYLYAIQQYIPPEEQEFVFLQGATITGEFDDVWASGQFDITYNPDNVTATVVMPPKPADVNGDGVVNIIDFLDLLQHWGPCPNPCPPCYADINYDCTVDVVDFLALIANWDPLP